MYTNHAINIWLRCLKPNKECKQEMMPVPYNVILPTDCAGCT